MLKTFRSCVSAAALLVGTLQPPPAWAQHASAVEQPFYVAWLKTLISRARAGDLCGSAALDTFLIEAAGPAARPYSGELMRSNSASMIGPYIFMTLAEEGGSPNARTIRRLLVEGESSYALASAHYFIGRKFDEGEGVPKNSAQAIRWYRIAADEGDAMAQYTLAGRYAEGKDLPEDIVKALRWYRLAATQGHRDAQRAMGIHYAEGKLIPRDDAEALVWLKIAAEQGDPVAQANLGMLYDEGRGTREDDAMAVKWYQIAAVQGSSLARAKLGFMYRDGLGVRKDLVTAYTLLSLVSGIEPGVSEAVEDLKYILKPAQIAKAAKRANRIFSQWRSRSGGN